MSWKWNVDHENYKTNKEKYSSQLSRQSNVATCN